MATKKKIKKKQTKSKRTAGKKVAPIDLTGDFCTSRSERAYTQAVTSAKRQAQTKVVNMILPKRIQAAEAGGGN
ncbi:MAG TPA: hypothetical protein VHF01_08890 [Candidatus Acidoferrum sp.]|nr:hypothetical protein [Candidatus Acidoferrum sp.]